MKKVVLAFSGGLDTSYCSMYLSKSCGFDVYAMTVNTGGFDDLEAESLKQKAIELGAKEYHFNDQTIEFYQKGIRFLLFGNVLKNNSYPLSVSAERVFQALAIADYAKKIDADAIAHGSTGAGNDQIRFDLVFQTLCPDMEIITPIRDNSLSREMEIEFLKKNGVELDWEKAEYSINQGLWGTSVGGKETLTSVGYLPERAFPSQLRKKEAETISIGFENGEPISINGHVNHPVEIIKKLQEISSRYAIGRDIHVGDTIIGIKGRVAFEAAAPLILIKAHHQLEKHVLSKHQLFIKNHLADWYGNLLHEGQYLDPVMRDIESFLENSQKAVIGIVKVRLMPYHFLIEGIISPNDLMRSSYGQYGEMNEAWTGSEARSFAKIFSMQTKILNALKS